MSFFNSEFPIKEKLQPKHPWERRINDKHSSTYKYGHNSTENPCFPPPLGQLSALADKGQTDGKRVRFIVIGNRVSKEFIYCLHMVKGLYKCKKNKFEAPIIRGLNSVEWPKIWNDLKIQFGAPVYCIKSPVAVLLDNEFLGGEEELKALINTQYEYPYPEYLDYYKEGVEQFANYVKSLGRPCAFLHICINDEPLGPLIFMLYADLVPITCQNFMKLCESSRGGYSGTPVHRIVQDGWIQCGGFGLKNDPSFKCENYIVPHDRRGVLCMANDGRNNDCSTQFFVLLQPATWMQNSYVAFGQLIEGDQTLKTIENLPTWYESPIDRIIIYRTGVFNTECQWRPVNRSATEYISGHIDDLVQIRQLIYDMILEKFHTALDKKLRQSPEPTDIIESTSPPAEPARTTVRFQRDKEYLDRTGTVSTVNNDFDVEEYLDGACEGEISDRTGSYFLPLTSAVVEKPYYIALTDVPYPGEKESEFSLQRLLKGEYCLEVDLISNAEERKKNFGLRELAVPEELLDTLFDCFEADDEESDCSLDSDDERLIQEYVKANVDKASFAGPIVKKIANIQEKYQIFDTGDETIMKPFLTDEEVRLLRIAAKEYRSPNKRKVAISLSTAMASRTKINRRPTGFIRPEDIAMLEQVLEKFMDQEEPDVLAMDASIREVKSARSVKIEAHKDDDGTTILHRRHTGLARTGVVDGPRESVLVRLYNDVTSPNEVPTLKAHKTASEETQEEGNFMFLTRSVVSFHDTKQDRMFATTRFSMQSTRLNLQHGKALNRKVSSDYANTLTRCEQLPSSSLRSVEFAKYRPAMTVAEYQLKNRQYQEASQGTTACWDFMHLRMSKLAGLLRRTLLEVVVFGSCHFRKMSFSV